MNTLFSEFTPNNPKLCDQLQGLSPITFSKILIGAVHLDGDLLTATLMAYKKGNHAEYYFDRRLRPSTIYRNRELAAMETQVAVRNEVDDVDQSPISTPNQASKVMVEPVTVTKSDIDEEHYRKLQEQDIEDSIKESKELLLLDGVLESPLEKGNHDFLLESMSGSSSGRMEMEDPVPLTTMVSPLDLVNHHSRSGTRSPSQSPDYSTTYSQSSDFTPSSGMGVTSLHGTW